MTYLALAKKGHAPLSLKNAFAMHSEFLASGDMSKTTFAE